MNPIATTGADLRAGRATCVRLVTEAIESLQAWESRLNAWISYSADYAIHEAELLDSELARGHDRGPLHGIPIGVKDNIGTADFRTTSATKVRPLKDSRFDAVAVRHLRDAGAIVIGKTNLH